MISKFKNEIFLFLTLLAGIFILYPFVDYQSIMATGDHGRDLYAAQVTLQGHIPYRDYSWVYGPLMPYYYALCFKLLSVHIPAVLMGKAFLALISCLFVYLTLTTAAVPCILAFIGAMWFLAFFPEFFITYNHIGGTVLLLALIYLIFRYLHRQKIFLLYLCLLCVFLLSLVKINFGITALFCLLTAVICIDLVYKNKITGQKKAFYLSAVLLLPVVVFPIYLMLLRELPAYAIRQCLPYLGGDQFYHTSVLIGIFLLLKSILYNITASWSNFFFAVLVIFSGIQTTRLLTADKSINDKTKTSLRLTIGILILFYAINIHEFLLSGIFYRSLWAKPFVYLLMFIVLATATERFKKGMRFLLYATLLLILGLQTVRMHFYIKSFKIPSHYLALERGKVSLGNDPAWLDTVSQTVSYLQFHLKSDELFFALPYDPLYYFLSGKESPTRQFIFFDYIKIPREQEKEILAELEKRKVNWILLSSRWSSMEQGLGILGKTYCPLIGEYIAQNFATVAEFGDWENPPGWAWNHGVKILKRINSTEN